jgi:E3 ubiquitin-protein ligase NEDD4
LVNENHLEYFYFIGRVVGMAAYHSRLIDGFFIRPFYKMMLNKPILLQDIEAVDIEYYKSMKFIIDTDDVESLDLTMTSETDVYGQKVEHELKPGGKEIKVTNENKKEFIDLIIQWRFVQRIEKQMNNFIKGFNEIVPQRCIQVFDPKEMELLLSGLGVINIKDWQINTLYKGEYNPQHVVIQWFWMAMYSFPNELRLRFLQFVTGTSRVPMNGFAELQGSNGYQKFTIQSWGDFNKLPRAHTWYIFLYFLIFKVTFRSNY